ncbi:PF14390 domain protein [Leptospira broomii serovar Hurstbridge str. 5399]|uniref:PF14390 domain protein n=1 Tax=Leptospira broomii serovar Hurstbridge str. 5399 TaxID=1049789 RepID=T0GIE4_9LEPT|nr:PD-(D/E)XK motif protein [Leptospira broomii]EQA46579.1 PF14390 domain protein [Leptospira broomii serovar Hurstbridge str. 5399]
MNLLEIFNSLSIPENSEKNFLFGVVVPGYPDFRIAVNSNGNPVLLLKVEINQSEKVIQLRNFRFKNFKIEHNKECKIQNNEVTEIHLFTIITFTGENIKLQNLFLKFSETLIKECYNQSEVVGFLNKYIEIFQTFSAPARKHIQGLWSELFLINNAKNPSVLLKYWHSFPEERYDFNAHNEKIEVKSTNVFRRIHTFSAEQLFFKSEELIIVASIFIKEAYDGLNIIDLIDSIASKVDGEFGLVNKLYTLVFKTLGNDLENEFLLDIRYDQNIAKTSLRFYNIRNIQKIDRQCIPREVTDVKYKSDLTEINEFKFDEMDQYGSLLNSL